jgi:hypothetical protein
MPIKVCNLTFKSAGIGICIYNVISLIKHYLFSCRASTPGCPDPVHLWATCGTSCRLPRQLARMCAWHFMSIPLMWTLFACIVCPALDPSSFLQGCPCSRRDAVCSVLAAFVLLVGASVAAVPVGSCVFASGLVRCSLFALALPPASRVSGHCPLPFRPTWGAEAEAPLG